jgi:hypothetical protein
MRLVSAPDALPGTELAVPHVCELGERHVERVDQAQEIEEADVGLAALDRADVVAVHVGAHPDALLAKAAAGAQLAHSATEREEGIIVGGESRAAHKAY